jgi:methionine-rich copper-binding protein CopC
MPNHSLILAAALALVATTADAHARLQRASPAVGSALKASPSEIRIDFDDELDDWKSSIALVDAGGHAVALGRTRLTGRPARGLAAALPVRLKPGLYRVKWQASSTDGHQSHGDFSFTIRP